MKKIILALCVLAFLLLTNYYLLITNFAFAEDCDVSHLSEMSLEQVSQMREKCERAWEMMEKAKKPHEENLKRMETQIEAFKKRITQIGGEIDKKASQIKTGEETLGAQEELLAARVRKFYIRSFYHNPFLIFFSQKGIGDFLRELGYYQSITDQEKKLIVKIVLYIKDLETKKENLEQEKEKLASLKIKIDQDAEKVRKLLGEATAYQESLEKKIAEITARQQQLLAEKYGGFTTSVGDVPLADDSASSPDFDPGFKPAFAAFSFGAPHRVGMNQYGAFGRSKAGQSAEEILKAYYSGVEIKKDYSVPDQIEAEGYGRIPFEDLYMKGIAEMPSVWADQGGFEALKAQAVAARSYALAVTNNGQSSICTTEACQVFIGKNKGGKWEEAVNQTKGWVAVKDGSPIKAWYASTAGGFTLSSASVWGRETSYAQGIVDTACNSASCWPNDAFDGLKYGHSPWFYKGWYKKYRAASATRSHPWLNQAEFVDILNTLMLYIKDQQTLPHLSQTDKENPDTWSESKIREELEKRGLAPINKITKVFTPQYSNQGFTAIVSFETDQGTKTFEGTAFKTIFNLRAPGEIHLASSLFNLEEK